MGYNSKFNAKASLSKPLRNDGCVVVYGTVNSAVTAAYNKDLVGRDENNPSNGRLKDVAVGGDQDAYSAFLSKASSSISWSNRYQGISELIMTITTTIGGLSKTQLQMAGNTKNRPIMYKETRYSQHTNGLVRDYATGDFTVEPSVVLDEFKQFGGSLSDDAARPTRSKPGEFIIVISDSEDPQFKDYQARTG